MNMKKKKCAALFRLVPVLALASWIGLSAAEPAKPALKPEPVREAAPLYQPVLLDALKLDWAKAEELRPGVRVFRLASEGAWQTRQLHEGPRLMKIRNTVRPAITGGRLIRVYIILTMIPFPRKAQVPSRIPKGMPRAVDIITDEHDT